MPQPPRLLAEALVCRSVGLGGTRLDRVPDAVHRPEDAGPQLAPQRPDVGVDRPPTGAVAVAPYLHEQLLAAVHDARALGQAVQEVKLRGRQMNGSARSPDA